MNKLLSVIVCTSLLTPLVAVAQSPKPIVPSTPLHQGLEARQRTRTLESECNVLNARQVLQDIYASEIRGNPLLAQVFADGNSAPVKAAINDCRSGREGGGRAGMDRWIRQAQNRQWYWQNLVSPALAQSQQPPQAQTLDLRAQCNAQVASEVLRDIFAPEIRNHPVLAQVFADANSAPVKGAINDCSVGREGGGRAGMDRWIRQAQNRQWYWQNLVSPTLAAAQASATPPPPSPPRFYQGEGQQAKAPARCEPTKVQLDPAKIENRERCFGAIGSGCKDQADEKFSWKKWPTPKVKNDCTIEAKVSVGSILHDSCCRTLWDQGRPGDGHFCKPAPGDASIWMGVDALAGYPAGWDNKLCAREWRKSVFDTA